MYPQSCLIRNFSLTHYSRERQSLSPINQLSSLFFAFAAVIVCDVFRTGDEDQNMAMPSSYLDLSSLYGETKESQNMVRTFVDGKLKPDAFADTRILSRPAAVRYPLHSIELLLTVKSLVH